ncbi:hypothetical protein FRB97_000457 [Tulasnella sp. 331]|nr:hypothetical protein FRB97_000457 [Tulasnella sp. 331]KAG8885316.1 hypothetical protein FRB98_001855 [Tulasnella sp. 332]
MSLSKTLIDNMNEKFTLVSEAITNLDSPATLDDTVHYLPLWLALRESCTPTGKNVADMWLAMASSKVVPGVIELLKKTIDRDSAGELSSFASNFTASCAVVASEALTHLNATQKAVARSFHRDLAAMAPEIISTWWKKIRHLKASWVQDGAFSSHCSGFLSIFRMGTYYGNTAIESTEYMSRSLSAHMDLHDYILFAGIFLERTDENGSDLLFAIERATTTRVPQNRLANLPSVKVQLESKPLALSARLAEILEVASGPERFEIVIHAVTNLSPTHINFLKQGDLAYALAASFWKIFAGSPRRAEKDRTTYDTLLIIRYYMLLRFFAYLHRSDANDRAEMARLFSQCDLLSLVEKVMMLQTTSLSRQPLENWNQINKLLTHNPDALRPPLRRDFLRMLDYLRTVKTAPGEYLLDMWLQLAGTAMISEAELREELVRERKAARGGLVGCSWYKCAMYEQESARDTFLCARCHKAVYCGPNCQDRDWKEGGHKAKCKASVMTALATR